MPDEDEGDNQEPLAIDEETLFLPPGVHRLSLAEFRTMFVDDAPNSHHRQRLYRAFELYVECLDELLPGATLWIDGGFVSHKADPPFDIDVAALVEPAAWASLVGELNAEMQVFGDWVDAGAPGAPPKTPTLTKFSGLMTLQQVQHGSTRSFVPRVQPFGGMIDGFMIPTNQASMLAQFRQDWMIDWGSGVEKGFVEVTPDGR